MGIAKSIGKGILGTGKSTLKAGDFVATKVLGTGTVNYAGRIGKSMMSSPAKTALFAGGAALGGYALADIDGRSDGGRVAGTAAGAALAVSGVPGMTALGAGLGVGMAGVGLSIGAVASGLGEMAIKTPKEPLSFSNMHELKFSKMGKAMMLGGALYEGATRAVDKYEKIRMGTNDGMLRHQTPIVPKREQAPSYANDAGATGDLVFSMYNNR